MELSFMEKGRVNHLTAEEGAKVGSIVPIIGTAMGAIGGAISTGQHTADRAGIHNWLMQNGNQNRLPYYPTKAEMLKAADDGHWEDHIKQSINGSYDPVWGTWDFPLDDFKGAVFSLNPIKAYIFKGSGERYEKDSNVLAIENGLKALQKVQEQQGNQAATTNLVTSLVNATGGQNGLLSSLINPSGSVGSNAVPNTSASIMGASGAFSNPIVWIILGVVVLTVIFILIKEK